MERNVMVKVDKSNTTSDDGERRVKESSLGTSGSRRPSSYSSFLVREYEARRRAEGRAAEWRMLAQKSRQAFEEDLDKNRHRLRNIENRMAQKEAEPKELEGKGGMEKSRIQATEASVNSKKCKTCQKLERMCSKCFGIAAYDNASLRHYGFRPVSDPSTI